MPGSIAANTDLWWHLRTGQWIVHHHAVPRTDPFSAYGLHQPWVAYSWLFEVGLYAFYRWFGLVGPDLFILPVLVAIAIALHRAIAVRLGGFIVPVVLTAIGLVAMTRLYSVRPWLYTILFFILEIDLLFDYLPLDKPRPLPRRMRLLPVLFLLWANLHVQFIYGLAVLALAALAQQVDTLAPKSPLSASRSLSPLWILTAVCALATLVNPYTWRIYQVVFEYLGQSVPFRVVTELMAPDFRSPLDFLVILLALAAAYVLAPAQIPHKPFFAALLVVSTVLSVRMLRDEWIVIVVALLTVAEAKTCAVGSPALNRPLPDPTEARLLAIVLTVAVIFATARARHLDDAYLRQQVASVYPVRAVEAVSGRHYPGPLYNDFEWGGYLMWALPDYPVALDGRTNLHGDQRIARSVATWSALPGWRSDPELQAARLIIGPAAAPLSEALATIPGLQLVYRDSVAVIYIRKQ